MILPDIQKKSSQEDFFIYAAADEKYFDLYAKPLINSVLKNTPSYGIHLHIYNPRKDQIDFCDKPGVSCSYEYIDNSVFEKIRNLWYQRSSFTNERQKQMRKKGDTLGPNELLKLVRQTYFACARFIRLNQIRNKGQHCLAIDVDGLVRKNFSYTMPHLADFYLYEKPKDGTHLAGALLFNASTGSDKFLEEYSNHLKHSIEQDDLYWFLDQVILDNIVPKYKKGLLPMSYIDWAMKPESSIWSAKGKRKELDIFKQEQRKYI
jgi:hypothetical protein